MLTAYDCIRTLLRDKPEMPAWREGKVHAPWTVAHAHSRAAGPRRQTGQ